MSIIKNVLNSYKGNKNLKPLNYQIGYTQKEILEYARCKNDFEYFAENYVKILTLDHGFMPFKLRDYQKRMINSMLKNRYNIILAPRQIGKSETVAAFFLWKVLFNNAYTCAIAAYKEKQARETLKRIQNAYERLPFFLQRGVKEWNKGSIELENNSRIITTSTSSAGLRGGAINAVMLDEFAHIDSNLADEFFTSTYPVLTAGSETQIIVVSTPKGMNHFYKMWKEAETGKSEFKHIEVKWNEPPGRDDNWKKTQIANIGETRFLQEYECAFVGTTGTLINPVKLREVPILDPIESKNNLDIWAKPFKGILRSDDELKHGLDHVAPGNYIVTVDAARGVQQDYSVALVVRIDVNPFEIVARYRSNTINQFAFPNVIYDIATTYNDAQVLVESNDVGEGILNALIHDLEYENVLNTESEGRNGYKLTSAFRPSKPGIRTTNRVKVIGANIMKTLVEEKRIAINDFEIIRELSNFVSKRNTFKAEEGQTDDIAMALLLFSWASGQDYFKEISEADARHLYLQDVRTNMEQMLPFGCISIADYEFDNTETISDYDDNSWMNDSRF